MNLGPPTTYHNSRIHITNSLTFLRNSDRIALSRDSVKSQGFSTHLLDHAIRARREARERKRLEILEGALLSLDRLSREIGFEEAYLFGSITKPYHFSGRSDLDIGFIGLKDENFFRAMAFLSHELGTEVDIVQLESYRMAGKIKNEGIKWRRKG